MTTKEIEKELIEGLKRQESLSQQQLLEQCGGQIFALLQRMIPRLEDAEEVYQDVFVKVFRSIRDYEPERAALSTWLSRIAYNEAIDFLRKRRQPILCFDEHEEELACISEEEVDKAFGQPNQETVQLIQSVLRQLPPDEKALVTMFYFDEKSLKEIAYITQSIPTTVASRLSRTRKKLYRIIKNLQS